MLSDGDIRQQSSRIDVADDPITKKTALQIISVQNRAGDAEADGV